MKKKNQGITLIALVITIIILLILAGVTIGTLSGTGIIEKAEIAKEKAEIANIKEEIMLKIFNEKLEENLSNTTLEKILEKYGTVIYEEDGETLKGVKTEKGYEILLSQIYGGTVENKEPIITKVANAPDITKFNASNTYYVTWDLTSRPYTISESTVISETEPNNWYDYKAGVNKWANVKTTGGGNDCYWVWIPRYAYKVPTRSSTAETIQIKFLEEATNIPIGEKDAITNTTPTEDSWVVHPAFTNAGNGGFGELTGIWVAKYEASSNSSSVVDNPTVTQLAIDGGSDIDTDLKVRVKPNVTSWRNITVGNIFTVCQNLTSSGNSLENTSNIDSHMMKNTEWGAVAYLSRSVYGKNGQVYNNPYYNDTTNYSPITGLCGNTQDYKTTTYNDTNTYKYNTAGGINASTSGNVYGIYDMVGGAWEYVAGIISSKKSNGAHYDFSDTKYTKYIDWYINYDNTKYGDAIYETSTSSSGTTSWYNDFSDFIYESGPVFRRGGQASTSDNKGGMFAFVYTSGLANTPFGFRPCLVITQE